MQTHTSFDTTIHAHIPALSMNEYIESIKGTDFNRHPDRLVGAGIGARENIMAMDAILPATQTVPSIPVPQQFLQEWLPGYVKVNWRALKIDDVTGMSIVGSWEMTQIVQSYLEQTGDIFMPYSDVTATPLANWNVNQINRGIAKFEQSFSVGVEEALQAARMNGDPASWKLGAVTRVLEQTRNAVGFFGYVGAAAPVYGFLNDPNLPAYTTVAAGVGGTTWAVKTFDEIVKDLQTMAANLQNQSGDNINPETMNLTLVVATVAYSYLNTPNGIGGRSVKDWLESNYKGVRIVSAPELNAASGGQNVAYLFADSIPDGSTDGGATFIQAVQAKLFLTGVRQDSKSYLQTYSNATAGVLCKRPWAVVRVQGI